MTPLKTLKAARQLISDPAKWTQGEVARDKSGKGLDHALSGGAVCWCSLGAIRKVVENYDDFDEAYDILRDKGKIKQIANFNDTHTHAEVLALFDAAIAELEGVQS
jgi:hypothetical protein